MSDHDERPEASSAPPSTLGVAREVQAIFATQDQLDEAMDALRLRGFDRADLSLPTAAPRHADATPELGAGNATTEIDRQQARTLGGSTAGVVAALGGAVLTVATGGVAAAAVGVAAVAGLAVGGATHAALAGGGETVKADRDEAADKGELVLAVAVRDAERESVALEVLRQSGASRAEAVERSAAVISSK
jgi:hypothetical protein